LVYSFIQVPALVLPLQLLHGFSYGTFQVGGVTYVNNRTPKSMRTTGQAIFTTISYGIGPIIGTLIGGYFYDTVGIATLFRILSVITIVGLSVFLFASKPRDEPGITVSVNPDYDPR
ncbi:MAG: MFS transporter, partial [Anaerolineales bacterium]